MACVPSGDVLRCLPISGLQTRWAHRLEVYVPLTRAYRRKHPMFIPAPKITPNVLGNLNMTAPLRTNKEAPPVSRRGPLSNCPNYRVIVMQQAPGQQAPPPQQPASLDEIVVALVSVIIAAIKSKYFMILSC